MRVAITGAGGFLGAHVVAHLAARGHAILGVPRDPAGDLIAPDASARADAFVHLGFPTEAAERRAQPIATLRAVVRGAAEAVTLAVRLGARHLVLASTGKVYGRPDAPTILDTTPARPTTQLGELKLLAEGIFATAARSAGLSATTLRIFNAYGPGQPASFLLPTVLAGLARGALGLGELDHARDWVHVDDVARAFGTAIRTPGPAGEVRAWNVASGEARSVRAILERLRHLGAVVPTPTVDASKLRSREAPEERAACEGLRAAGWSPEVALDDGLRDLLVRHGLLGLHEQAPRRATPAATEVA